MTYLLRLSACLFLCVSLNLFGFEYEPDYEFNVGTIDNYSASRMSAHSNYLILNDLAIERGKSEAKVDSVLPLSSISRNIKSNSIEQVILHLLKEFKIKTIEVHYNFTS